MEQTTLHSALSDLSDEDLAIAHLEGDPDAFRELYNRYEGRLTRFIVKKIGYSEQAKDLLQETFIRVARHLHRFDADRKFSTWVYTIAGNLCKNEIRNRSRSPFVSYSMLERDEAEDHSPLQFADSSMKPDVLYRKRSMKEVVDEVVKGLPNHHRLIFTLREMQGKSYREVAEILGVNLGTVKSRLHRARTAFAQTIAPRILTSGRPPELIFPSRVIRGADASGPESGKVRAATPAMSPRGNGIPGTTRKA